MSEKMRGDVMIIENRRRPTPVRVGEFTFRTLYLPKWLSDVSGLRNPIFWSYVLFFALFNKVRGAGHHVIWASDPFNMGVIAVILKRLTGVPVFLEVIGNLERSTELGRKHKGFIARWKSAFIKAVTPRVLNAADSVRLVYPSQVDFLGELSRREKYTHYPGYVAVDMVDSASVIPDDQDYILLLGSPWYLKGVDLLINAFNEIADDYPDLNLKVIGYEARPQPFLDMVRYPDRVEFDSNGREYDQVIQVLKNCRVLVLASRTEAYARVLTEAMASRRPIVASAVDGIPTYITEGENGVLFQPENGQELVQKIRLLLDQPKLAKQLSDRGYRYAKENISEQCYVDNIRRSIDRAIATC